MRLSSKIILILAFMCGLAAYNLRFWLWEDAFYHLIAVEFVLLYGLIWSELKGTWRLISQVFFLACINSLVDELFFDPGKISVNEWAGFVLIIITTFLLYGKNRK